MSLAPLFGVSTGQCNSVILAGSVEQHSLVLAKHIPRSDGRMMSLAKIMNERVINDTIMFSC
jgi:hypothetical protein